MVPKSNHKCPYERETEGDLTHRDQEKVMADEGRVWGDAATRQGTPTATRNLERQGTDSPLTPPEGGRP